jgi:hypothetical protein
MGRTAGCRPDLRLFQEIKYPENLGIAVSHSRNTIGFWVIIFLEWPNTAKRIVNTDRVNTDKIEKKKPVFPYPRWQELTCTAHITPGRFHTILEES